MITVQGVKGMKSVPFEKTFKTIAAYNAWMEKHGADVEIYRTSFSQAFHKALEADINSK